MFMCVDGLSVIPPVIVYIIFGSLPYMWILWVMLFIAPLTNAPLYLKFLNSSKKQQNDSAVVNGGDTNNTSPVPAQASASKTIAKKV